MQKALEVAKNLKRPEAAKYGMSFKPRPDDVFVTTYPKCGTTWVTQICHMLRSNGDMSFDDLGEVVPWDMMAKICEQDLDAEQVYNPRVFKSHFPWPQIAKGGKYIHVVRDPVDVLKSFYPFFVGFTRSNPEDISLEEFFEQWYMSRDSNNGVLFDYYCQFLEAEGDILWVFYEDIRENPLHEITRIAKFMGLEKTLEPEDFSARCKLATEMSTKEFMMANPEKFNDSFLRSHILKNAPKASGGKGKPKVQKVNKSKKKEVSAEMLAAIDKEWNATVNKKFGYASYEDMRKKMER